MSKVVITPFSRVARLAKAHVEERDGYRRMRDAIPDLSKPAAERQPVSALHRDLISRWSHSIEYMRKMKGTH